MTDARMPERYLNDRMIQRLSDGAFRAFVCATMWSVSNRTDGVLEEHDIPLIPGMSAEYVQELIKAEKLNLIPAGYLLADFSATQTSREELSAAENARIKERDKKRAQRAAARDRIPLDVPGDVPGDGELPAQERKGQARQGQDRPGEAVIPSHLHTVPTLENDMQRNARASWAEVVA